MTYTKLSFILSGLLSTAALAQNEVRPLSNMMVPMSRYGSHWQNTESKMLVKNIAFEKKVQVIFEGEGTEPEVAEARYFGPASDGYEIWIAHKNVGKGPHKFHAKYEVAGETFVSESLPLTEGPALFLEQPIQQLSTAQEIYGDNFKVSAAVKNLSLDKKVTLHYSWDNFQSENVVAMEYTPSFFLGYGTFDSPTADGLEMWSIYIDTDKSSETLSYYVSFETNGKLYRDDNFGQFYKVGHVKQ